MSAAQTEGQSVDYYFDSYSHFGIHEDMLKDEIRTLAYRDAILKNPSLVAGKVVLDVGCGTGILSMFAAKAGAKKVYAVEKSRIVDSAREIIAINGFSDVITVIEGGIEEVEIPEKVDLIISEWMGYALLYESMLPSVIYARDKYMKEGGSMWPSHATIYLSAMADPKIHGRKIGFWDEIYGFSYEPIRQWSLSEAHVFDVDGEKLVADDCVLVDLDLNTCKVEDLTIVKEFDLWPFSEQNMDAFVLWFDVFFRGGEEEIVLSTSPYTEPTHWSQTVFFLDGSFKMKMEEYVHGQFEMRPNQKNPRDQDFKITFTMNGKELTQEFKMR